MRHKCYQFVCHLITLRIVEADAVIKTVTITSSSVTTTNFLSNEVLAVTENGQERFSLEDRWWWGVF